MKLGDLVLTNWLTHNHLVVEFSPLTIIAGRNGAGKSAVGDALAFALTGELRRIEARSDRQHLLTEGTEKGSVMLTCAGEGRWMTLLRDVATGKLKKPEALPLPPGTPGEALPYALQPRRFALAAPNERRQVLRAIMGAELGAAAILARLRKRGFPDVLVELLKPTATLDEWTAFAGRQATEARGAWRAITNEAYGPEKAEGFQITAPDGESEDVVNLIEDAVRGARGAVAHLERELASIDATAHAAAATEKRVSALSAAAAEQGSHERALDAAKEVLATCRSDVEKAKERVMAARAAMPAAHMHCPGCGASLVVDHDRLLPYRAPQHPATQADLDNAERALSRATTAEATALTRMEEAATRAKESKLAADTLAKIRPQGTLPTTVDRADVQAQLDEARAAEAAYAHEAARARDGLDATARAAEHTRRAATFHQTVKAWSGIAAALAPDGIPGEILRDALDPFNATLAELAASADWHPVRIGADMAVRAGGRLYPMLSESEQWRADAQLAVAIAHHSAFRAVILDRFDVLDLRGRGQALSWLHRLTAKGTVEQVVVLATMKAPPRVPAGVAVHWLGVAPAEG